MTPYQELLAMVVTFFFQTILFSGTLFLLYRYQERLLLLKQQQSVIFKKLWKNLKAFPNFLQIKKIGWSNPCENTYWIIRYLLKELNV